MNWIVFRSLFWKERRQIQVFAALFLALSLGFLFYFAARVNHLVDFTPTIALLFPILYAVATTATAFANEHEAGTFEFQRSLPAPFATVFIAKLSLAVIGSVALLTILWSTLLGLRIAGIQSNVSDSELGAYLLDGVTTLVEFLIFGTLASLIERRPLVAIVKATAMVLSIRGLATLATWRLGLNQPGWEMWAIMLTGSLRLACALGGIAAIVFFSRRWYYGESLRLSPFWLMERLRATGPSHWYQRTFRSGRWNRLIWLQWRVNQWPLALSLLTGIAAIYWPATWVQRANWADLMIPLIAYATGVITFRSLHANRSILLAWGAEPTRLWLSQVIVTLVVVGGLISFLIWHHVVAKGIGFGDGPPTKSMLTAVLIPTAAIFSASQLASLLSRSLLIAFGLAGVYSAALMVWISTLQTDNTPLWPFYIPIILYPLVESFTRIGGVLKSWSPNIRWWLIRGAFFFALMTAVYCYRVFQIPNVSSSEVDRIFAQLPSRSNADFQRFRAIAQRLRDSKPSDQTPWNMSIDDSRRVLRERKSHWVAEHHEDLQTILNFHLAYPAIPSDRQLLTSQDLPWIWYLQEFLQAAFARAVDQGDVELGERILVEIPYALDPMDVMHWGWLAANDSQRIRSTIDQLQQMETPDELVKLDKTIFTLTALLSAGDYLNFGELIYGLWQLPIAKRQARLDLKRYARANEQLLPMMRAGQTLEQIKTSLSASARRDNGDQRSYYLALFSAIQRNAHYLRRIRGVSLQLALILWQRDHDGKLPETLDDLAEHYSPTLVLDPASDREFLYVNRPVAMEPRLPGYQRDWIDELRNDAGLVLPFIASSSPAGRLLEGRLHNIQKMGADSNEAIVRLLWDSSNTLDFIVYPLGPPKSP